MRIQWFQVQGYKNLRGPVRLDDLGRFNVVHGDNNVGKSNLVESIGLFFAALEVLREEERTGPSLDERHARRSPPPPADGRPRRSTERSFAYFAGEGYPPGEIFDIKAPRPIVLEAALLLDTAEGDPPWLDEQIEVRLILERGDEEVTVRVAAMRRAHDGADLANAGGDAAAIDAAFRLVLARLGRRVRGKEIVPRFALLRADRTLVGGASEEDSPLAAREPLPRGLARELHDAESATDGRKVRFKRFLHALEGFRDLVGAGKWRMRYETEADRAELVLDDGEDLVPLRLMGSGIQQIAALTARLALLGADVVAVEEPELNLRWSAQRALRGVLSRLAQEGGVQLLLTSHSAQFEEEPTFYLLTRGEAGPEVHKKAAAEAPLFTDPGAPLLPTGARAPRGYLTTEGVVEVAPEVQEALGLRHGGGVVFVKGKDGHYRMLTDDQFADLFEDREPSA